MLELVLQEQLEATVGLIDAAANAQWQQAEAEYTHLDRALEMFLIKDDLAQAATAQADFVYLPADEGVVLGDSTETLPKIDAFWLDERLAGQVARACDLLRGPLTHDD